MRELQIYILDLDGNQIGELDLTDSDDFALKLTKSIASINNLGRRNTSFSLDFDAPQTKNNNKLLAGLRFATHSKEILGQKPCAIMVDGNQVDRGFVYPFESTLEGSYKLVFKGLNNDWVEKLKDVELNQLNWRDYDTGLRTEDANELYSSSRFSALNSLTSVDADLVYPYINRLNGGEVTAFRPQLHLRSIIISMFEKIGYTVSSVFLESDWIKGGVTYDDVHGNEYTHLGLSVDPTFQMTRDQQDLLNQTVEYTTAITAGTDPELWTDVETIGNLNTPAAPNVRDTYRFPTVIDTVVLDDFSRWNIPTSEFTVGLGGTYELSYSFSPEWAFNFDGTWKEYIQAVSPFEKRNPNVTMYIVKNNTSDTVIDGTIIYEEDGDGGFIPDLGLTGTAFHTFTAGDKISVFMELKNDAFGFTGSQAVVNADQDGLDRWKLRPRLISLTITPKANVQLGNTFRINSHIPAGIKCMTLLQDFKTMFNLYFDVDVNRKVVFIEPRDDFYGGTPVDITDKIDLSTPPSLNYLTDYKNEVVFKYAVDGKDKYLEKWNKINDNTYAELTYSMQNNSRFDKGQSVLSTQFLSATIQGFLDGSSNICTSIVKEEYLEVDNEGKLVNQNYAPRVYQLIRGQQFDPANNPRRTESPLTVLVAAMEEFANTPTFEDRRLTFNAENGLVWGYYRKTLANIEDTAVLTCKINLSLPEFNSWDLSKIYYINEPAEIAGAYITDSIKNFNITKEAPTTITLVKFKDFTPVEITGGAGNVNVITENIPQPQEIMVTVNGAIVSCLDNDLNKMYTI